jgi:rRNA-processing protein FCF1
MSKVLIDACGWAAIIEGGFNVDLAMADVVGTFEPVLLNRVLDELKMIQEKTTSPLLLDFLKSRSELIAGPEEASHPDDQLVIIASRENWPVLTVDRRLKQRLVEMNCSYIEVMSGQNLRLVSL